VRNSTLRLEASEGLKRLGEPEKAIQGFLSIAYSVKILDQPQFEFVSLLEGKKLIGFKNDRLIAADRIDPEYRTDKAKAYAMIAISASPSEELSKYPSYHLCCAFSKALEKLKVDYEDQKELVIKTFIEVFKKSKMHNHPSLLEYFCRSC
jgi:hypothetical protein